MFSPGLRMICGICPFECQVSAAYQESFRKKTCFDAADSPLGERHHGNDALS
jgi:hypothetical protein